MHHIQYLLKFFIAAITRSALWSTITSPRVLTNFHPGRLHLLGVSLYLFISHRNAHSPYYCPWYIHCNLTYQTKKKYSSKGQIYHLFTPSVTTDINLVPLRETAQVLLRYILSHHLRHANSVVTCCNIHEKLQTAYIGYLPVHWTGLPVSNTFLTQCYNLVPSST